jgi:hypothetical protein
MNITKISELSNSELLDMEKLSVLICKKYENSSKMYDGTVNTKIPEYHEFNFYNKIHMDILNEIERRLKKLKQ